MGTGTTQNYNCNSDSGVTFNSTIHSGTTRGLYQDVLWSDMYSGQTLFVDSIPFGTTHVKVVANRRSGVCNNLQPHIICIQGRPTPTPTPSPSPTSTPTPTPSPTSTPTPTATSPCSFDGTVVYNVPPTPTPTPTSTTPTPTPTSTTVTPTSTPQRYYYQGFICGTSTGGQFYSETNLGDVPGIIVFAYSSLGGEVNQCFDNINQITTPNNNPILNTFENCAACTGSN